MPARISFFNFLRLRLCELYRPCGRQYFGSTELFFFIRPILVMTYVDVDILAPCVVSGGGEGGCQRWCREDPVASLLAESPCTPAGVSG